MKNKVYNNSIRHIWMIMALLALSVFIHKTYKTKSLEDSFMFLLIFIVSIAIFLVRTKLVQKDKSK